MPSLREEGRMRISTCADPSFHYTVYTTLYKWLSMLFSNLKLATMASGQPYGLVEDGAVIVEDGQIAWAGARKDAPVGSGRKTVDCGGRLLTPGLIDCHTH